MAEMWDVLDENGNRTGRLCERGPMNQGEYHLIVHVWVMNSKNEFLISKRTSDKQPYPNMWECTGGSAVAGDDSITTALKEVQEELGIVLEPKNGQLFKRYTRTFENGSGDFNDIWIFRQEVDLSCVTFQANETCDAMFADKAKIEHMISDSIFLGRDVFPYLDELFCLCD